VSASKCECSMAIAVLGDGCRYCQPQEYINQLEEWLDEDRARVAELGEYAANMFNAITMDNHALNEAAQTEADTALFNSTEDYAIWCEDQPSDSRAWLLRQKADAVEEFAVEIAMDWPTGMAKAIKADAEEYAEILRKEADAAGGGV
jgi:hypothetical protein